MCRQPRWMQITVRNKLGTLWRSRAIGTGPRGHYAEAHTTALPRPAPRHSAPRPAPRHSAPRPAPCAPATRTEWCMRKGACQRGFPRAHTPYWRGPAPSDRRRWKGASGIQRTGMTAAIVRVIPDATSGRPLVLGLALCPASRFSSSTRCPAFARSPHPPRPPLN